MFVNEPSPHNIILSPSDREVTVGRKLNTGADVLFLDGLTGTGKTMITPILSSLKRVEVQRMEPIYEYLIALRLLGRIEDDAAIQMISMYIDIATYNVMIGRECNFRWKDLSGVTRNPGGWRYVRRLFQPDGDAVLERIKKERPILQIVSHQIADPLVFSALGERAFIVEMVRHPLYLIDHWFSYIDRYGNDSREFNVWINYNGNQLPWFAADWEEQYIQSNKMDRVILSIQRLLKMTEERMGYLSEQERERVLVIPFEKFVTDPWVYINNISDTLTTTPKSSIRKTMRKEKVPRRLMSDGRDLPIYRRYNWEPPQKSDHESDELNRRRMFAKKGATPFGMRILEEMSEMYEQRFLG